MRVVTINSEFSWDGLSYNSISIKEWQLFRRFSSKVVCPLDLQKQNSNLVT